MSQVRPTRSRLAKVFEGKDIRFRIGREEYKLEETLSAVGFLLPAMLVLGTFTLLPAVWAAWISLQQWNIFQSADKSKFVGLANYSQVLADPEFWKALWNTVYYAVGTIPVGVALSLGIAMLLNQKLKGLGFYRGLYFMPVVTSTVAISTVWMWIYHPGYGLLNEVLGWVGISPQLWLRDPKLAMPAIILMGIWKGLGYDIVLLLAGLQNIPRHLYEAAALDGAGRRASFWNVTLPLLSPTLLFVVIMAMINTFQVFTQVHVMTGGGPLGSTKVLVYYMWEAAFQRMEMGYASAISYLLFVMLFVLTLVQMRFARKYVHYE